MQEKGKQHVTHLQNVVKIKFHSKSWTAKQCLAGILQSRGPPKGHLVAFGCPGFVGEFNTYNIMEMSSMSFTTLLKGGPQLYYAILLATYTLHQGQAAAIHTTGIKGAQATDINT